MIDWLNNFMISEKYVDICRCMIFHSICNVSKSKIVLGISAINLKHKRQILITCHESQIAKFKVLPQKQTVELFQTFPDILFLHQISRSFCTFQTYVRFQICSKLYQYRQNSRVSLQC